jgi:hypothetical protein
VRAKACWEGLVRRGRAEGGLCGGAGRGEDVAPDSQDALLELCLLAGLLSLSDSELPLLTSDFYSKHMLPAKPPGTHLPPTLPL